MKSGKHPHNVLTSVRLKSLSKPGKYADGNGLYLVVDPSGAKRWVLRTVVHGRRRDIGLGGVRLVSLAEARAKAIEFRKLAREGGNPLEARRRGKDSMLTFSDVAKTAYASYKGAWRNDKHSSQWISSLEAYAIPIIGEMRIDEVDTSDVLRVLSPIWLSKPETARRVRQRITSVLDWAKAAGFRSGENPAAGVSKGLPKQPDRKNHFGAIAYKDVPRFVRELRTSDGNDTSRLAFEFLILTATRTNEVLNAHWDEFDLKQKTWIIPGSRMKAGREHRVPLGPRSLELLRAVRKLSDGGDIVFPGVP